MKVDDWIKLLMSYNSNCNYQNCEGGCCNYYGDCPEWYSNGVA